MDILALLLLLLEVPVQISLTQKLGAPPLRRRGRRSIGRSFPRFAFVSDDLLGESGNIIILSGRISGVHCWVVRETVEKA